MQDFVYHQYIQFHGQIVESETSEEQQLWMVKL